MVKTVHPRLGLFGQLTVIVVVLFSLLQDVVAANGSTNAASANGTNQVDSATASSQESLRSYLQIQDQLHSTQATLEKNRQEAEAAAVANAEIMDGRLTRIEKMIASERLNELKGIEHSQHTILIAAGAFTVIGFLILLAAALLQWMAINRLMLAAKSQMLPALNQPENQVLMSQAVEQSTQRFLGVLEKFEQRMYQLETTVLSRKALPESNGNGEAKILPAELSDATPSLFATGNASPVALLLGKGQSLLKLDKWEPALECFDQALALDPANTDALIRKGATLERLQRLSEAVECYNRAISHDNSLTMAYLYKGAVFNRMERYGEALECYEQALKTRQKGHAANVIFE